MTLLVRFLLLLLWLAPAAAKRKAASSLQKDVTLINESHGKLNVYWVHPTTRALSIMNADAPVLPGVSIPLQSFVNHEFEIHEVASDATGECVSSPDKTCRRAIFQVTPHDDQSK